MTRKETLKAFDAPGYKIGDAVKAGIIKPVWTETPKTETGFFEI